MISDPRGRLNATVGRRFTDSIHGFTLIELLTAIVVLVIIVTLLAQMLNLTGQAISMNTHVLTSTRNNRAVLDVLSTDLDNIVLNRNLSIFVKSTSNTYAGTPIQTCELSFVTRARGPSGSLGNYRFMAVSYVLKGNQLQRTYSPVSWPTSNLTSAVVNPVSPVTTVLAYNVLSFEASVVLDCPDTDPLNGSNTTVALAPMATTPAPSPPPTWLIPTINGQPIPNSFYAVVSAGTSIVTSDPRVRGLVVGVVSLDDQSALINNSAVNMAPSFGVPPNGQTPSQAWNTSITGGALTGFPKPAVAGVHVDQLYISLP